MTKLGNDFLLRGAWAFPIETDLRHQWEKLAKIRPPLTALTTPGLSLRIVVDCCHKSWDSYFCQEVQTFTTEVDQMKALLAMSQTVTIHSSNWCMDFIHRLCQDQNIKACLPFWYPPVKRTSLTLWLFKILLLLFLYTYAFQSLM